MLNLKLVLSHNFLSDTDNTLTIMPVVCILDSLRGLYLDVARHLQRQLRFIAYLKIKFFMDLGYY